MKGRSSPDVDHLIGYTGQWSVQPGDRIDFKISCTAPEFRADLVRVWRSGDSTPVDEVRETVIEDCGSHDGRVQPILSGSCAVVDLAGHRLPRGFSVCVWVWPTLLGQRQAIVALNAAEHVVWSLELDADGRPCFETPTQNLILDQPLATRRWTCLAATYQPQDRTVRLSAGARQPTNPVPVFESREVQALPLDCDGNRILIGARALVPDPNEPTLGTAHFNGKVSQPVIYAQPLTADQERELATDLSPRSATLFAAWDFAAGMQGSTFADRGPHALAGILLNGPKRAVTGHNWRGRELDWRRAPAEYGAVHFCGDDLIDAGWDTNVSIAVPEDAPSGVYALRVEADAAADRIPFIVRPPTGHAAADVAVVLPTMTYLAYANERLPTAESYLSALREGIQVGEQDVWLDQQGGIGGSLYDVHGDGSGVCYASRLRPIPNLRPAYRHWIDGLPRHLSVDLYLIGWLESQSLRYDVISDEDVDDEGVELLARYRVVITGNHPEYVTEDIWDAFAEYLAGGGRVMYLGGNGFYWVTSRTQDFPGIEVRRDPAPLGSWSSPAGELHHSSTGEPGGHWRYRGRNANQLLGVGTAAMTAGVGDQRRAEPFHRTPAGHDPHYSWVFEGTAEGEIGGFGVLMGGAAGHEIDRFDAALGSPLETVVLASSRDHSDSYIIEPCDAQPFGLERPDGEERVRADLTLLANRQGGAVFCASSICWLGSLAHDDYDNDVARVTANVLREFRDPHSSALGPTRASQTASNVLQLRARSLDP